MLLIARGVWHFTCDRQPNKFIGRVASANAEVGTDPAVIIRGTGDRKTASRRNQHCATDLVPRCDAIDPHGVFGVYSLHKASYEDGSMRIIVK
jgi:hypothetical protein